MEILDSWFQKMIEEKASDLFITVGVPPTLRVDGEIRTIQSEAVSSAQAKEIIFSVMDEKQQKEFLETKELNFVVQKKSIGRFRISAFQQRTSVGAVVRRIETSIPTLEALEIPEIVSKFSLIVRGMVLVVGATGVGKSSTLAAMIQYRNQNTKGHIITIEDPIEYIHKHESSIVTQREVGIDTDSFEVALKNALRQSPDVILIGEIRSRETMEYAMEFAKTGHLCLATLHANNANQALERIISFFPHEMHEQLLMDLSLNLRAIVAQQLIPRKDGKGRTPVVEILINTPAIAEKIRKGEVDVIRDFMTRATENGMQTYDQSLFRLYAEGKISYETALKYAESANELRLMIKLNKGIKGNDSPSFRMVDNE